MRSNLEIAQKSLKDAVDVLRQQGLQASNLKLKQQLNENVIGQGKKRLLDVAADSQKCQQDSATDIVPPEVAEYLPKDSSGIYVDVGSGDGIFNSKTLYFERVLCWKGVAFEPASIEFPKLKDNRPRALTLNAALCEDTGHKVFSDVTSEGKWTGWSGFQDTFSEKKRRDIEKVLNDGDGWLVTEYQVECVSGVELFQELDLNHVNLLVLSVEGHEIEALRGIPEEVEIDVLVVDIHHRPSELLELL